MKIPQFLIQNLLQSYNHQDSVTIALRQAYRYRWTEITEIKKYTHSSDFQKGCQDYSIRKGQFMREMDIHMKNMKLDTYLKSYTKFSSNGLKA